MDIKFFEELCNELNPFLSEQGFKLTENNLFTSSQKNYKIDYNDSTSQFILSVAAAVDGDATGEYVELSSWYFDEQNHGVNDIKVIAEDFIGSISGDLGIVKTKKVSTSDVAMPTKAVGGETPGIEAFTNKFLSSFPQYKDTYKAHVAKYGKFLPVEFYKVYGVEKCREVINSQNKKAIDKLFSMLSDMYVEADTVVGDLICAVIIAGTFKGNMAEFEALAEEYLADNIHLKQAGKAIIKEYNKNAKLKALLG